MPHLVTLATHAIAAPSHVAGPLSLLLSPSGHYAVEAGETFDISLTLHNQGTQGAVIDVYVDENAQEFSQWCRNPYERLALEQGHSSEVRFQVTIPVQTLPGTYDYLIVVDAPKHYPEETPLRYPATVRVLPPVKSGANLNDATFATRPETRSDKPAPLEANTPTEVQVIVHNRSNRVDQFRLEITDFPDDWYEVIYPEGLGELGLVIDTDHLALNPGARGRVRLLIQCPVTTLAGRYLATLRLRSANEPKLVLMDVLYFEVPAVYDLAVQVEAIVRKVKRQAALFHLHITNSGNTARNITLDVKEDREDPLFLYTLNPPQLRVPSMSTIQVALTATPDGMRRRAWIGQGRQVSFRLEVEDEHTLPLSEATTAELLWERRPWWHMALILLLAAGIVSTVVGLIWWLLLRPPAAPKVSSFDASAPTYYQQRDDFVRLNWQIENAQQIQSLKVEGQTDGAGTPLPAMVYDLSDGLPSELAHHCVLEQDLRCSNVLTGARQPGSYGFTLTVIPKGDRTQPIMAETGEIAILPTPPPKIVTFAATQARYWEPIHPELLKSKQATRQTARSDIQEETPSQPPAQTVALNWQVMFTEPLSHLTLAGFLADGSPLSPPQRYDLAKGLPEALERNCVLADTTLTCRSLPTTATVVGTYTFELAVFADASAEAIAAATTQPIQIVPAPIRIGAFTLNGEDAPAKSSVTIPVDSDATSTVKLSWRVVGGPHTEVEILPTPGTVSPVGTLEYPLTPNTQEVITLRVTAVSGEQITRSLILETTQPTPPLPPSTIQPEAVITIPPPPPAERSPTELPTSESESRATSSPESSTSEPATNADALTPPQAPPTEAEPASPKPSDLVSPPTPAKPKP